MPRMQKRTLNLIDKLKTKSRKDLQDLMSISENLADLNYRRYQSFESEFRLNDNAKQALLAFDGDVYTGLDAASFDEADLKYAQRCIRILSGLYGILRPLDLMQPYRLEMGTKLATDQGDNLYDFWGKTISEALNEDVKEQSVDYILNLASNEYYKSVDQEALQGKLVEIDFKEWRDDKFKIIPFNAKKARGSMAKLVVKERAESLDTLKQFEVDGYRYNEDLSAELHLIYTK